jgi:membrane-bound serine protease (ClpP class)
MAAAAITRGSLNPAKHGIPTLPPNPKVMIIPIDDKETTYQGYIDEWQAAFVERRLKRAKDEKFNLVILEIDTYGGEVLACEHINRAIANCGVPVVAYVKSKAFSGGAIISLGCKAIVMGPGSQIGGALAVNANGAPIDKDMRKKHDSSMTAMVKDLCIANHHSFPIARGMVDSSIDLIETNDPTQRFMTDIDYSDLKIKPAKIHTWKTKDQILTLSSTEAVDTGLAAGIAANTDEVLTGLGLSTIPEIAGITPVEKIVRWLSNPIWRVLIVVAGIVALFLELKSPGHGAGYLAFALCMGVFFWLQIFVSNCGMLELALFGLGAILVAVEIFVFPTVGALAFVGFGMLILSIVLSFLPEGTLSSLWSGNAKPWEMEMVTRGLMWSAITLVSIIVITVTAVLRGAALPGVSRLALKTAVHATVGSGGAVALSFSGSGKPNLEALVGQSGSVETVLRPTGKVRVNGITYEAVSEGGFLDSGVAVTVLRVSPTGLVVRQTPGTPIS